MEEVDAKIAIDFWLNQAVVDMNDDTKWENLKQLLVDEKNVCLDINILKRAWIERIDKELAAWSEDLSTRSEFFKWEQGMGVRQMLQICGKRVENVKSYRKRLMSNWVLQQRQSKVVGMEGTQIFNDSLSSTAETVLVPKAVRCAALVTKADADSTSSEPSMAQKRKAKPHHGSNIGKKNKTTIGSSFAGSSYGKPEDEGHSVVVGLRAPNIFTSCTSGAFSIDVSGWQLPKQCFAGITFHVLQEQGNYIDVSFAIGYEYLIKVHGGVVISTLKGISPDTIIIASQNEFLNEKIFHETEAIIVDGDALKDYIRRSGVHGNLLPFTLPNISEYVYWPETASEMITKHQHLSTNKFEGVSIPTAKYDLTDPDEELTTADTRDDGEHLKTRAVSLSDKQKTIQEERTRDIIHALMFSESYMDSFDDYFKSIAEGYEYILDKEADPGYLKALAKELQKNIESCFERLKAPFHLTSNMMDLCRLKLQKFH